MTNAEKLLDVIGDVQDEYIKDVPKRISAIRNRKIIKWTSIAAVFTLIIGSFSYLLGSINWGNAGLGVTGQCAGGYFYYQIPNDGIYRYTPKGESEQLIKTKFSQRYDYSFVVNDTGLFYSKGDNAVYKIPHNSDEATLFYEAPKLNELELSTHTSTDIMVLLNYYSINNFDYCFKEIVVDGVSGKQNEILHEYRDTFDSQLYNEYIEKGYSDDDAYNKANTSKEFDADEIEYKLGNRTLVAKNVEDGIIYTLEENGSTLLKEEDILWEQPEKATEDYIIFKIGESYDEVGFCFADYYIARANGKDSRITSSKAIPVQGDDDYLYYIDYDDNIMCVDTRSGEEHILMYQKDLSYKTMFSDGKYIYTADYDNETPAQCYEILFDENLKPYDLHLIDDDIMK